MNIGEVWDKLSDVNRANITELLFGKRQTIVSIRSNAHCKTHLIAGNPLEPCTTIVEKSHYDGLKTQGLGVHAAKLLRAIA